VDFERQKEQENVALQLQMKTWMREEAFEGEALKIPTFPRSL